MVLFDSVLDDKPLAGGNAYYSAADGEVVFGEVATEVARVLHDLGVLKTAEITQPTPEEIAQVRRCRVCSFEIS